MHQPNYIEFAISLIGVPYGYWSGSEIPRDDSTSFYASNDNLPSYELILSNGISCTGLVNLLRRYLRLVVPGVDDPHNNFPGGTVAWYKYLEPHLIYYDNSIIYPNGTLLLRPYKDFTDQGHIAIVVDNKTLHSFPFIFDPFTEGTNAPGVSITAIWEDYYIYAAPPSAWVLGLGK